MINLTIKKIKNQCSKDVKNVKRHKTNWKRYSWNTKLKKILVFQVHNKLWRNKREMKTIMRSHFISTELKNLENAKWWQRYEWKGYLLLYTPVRSEKCPFSVALWSPVILVIAVSLDQCDGYEYDIPADSVNAETVSTD